MEKYRSAKKVPTILLTMALVLCLSPTSIHAKNPTAFWLQRVFLVDPTEDAPPRLADLRIDNGRIAEIRDHVEASTPDLPIIEADGRFLVAGFIDTHAHVALGPIALEVLDGQPQMKILPDPEVAERSLLTLLAHGITTVRDPGGPSRELVTLRDQTERGARLGPRLRVAGEVIDSQTFHGLTTAVDGPEEVRAEVRRQARAGVDWIKLYTQLSPEELQAGIEEAHVQGLPAVAHLQRISWTEAANWGLDALVHVVPGSEKLLPTASRSAYLPDLAGTQCLYSWFEHVDLESPEIENMLRALKQHGTTLDLTLVAFEAMVHGDDPSRTRFLPELRLAAPGLVENWRSFFTFNVGWDEEDFIDARRAWPTALVFARRLHDAGIHLTIGTDANNPWTVPGPSFHRELELLAEAGIPNRDLLRMATQNGAEALRLDDRVGKIEVGYEADLVLLKRNPLIDISATREIIWVMQSGRIHSPDDLLDRLLKGRSEGTP